MVPDREPVVLTAEFDRGWIVSAGLPVTAAQLATLQTLIDTDDEAARTAFLEIVGGRTSRAAIPVQRRLSAIVGNFRTMASLGLDVAKIFRAFPGVLNVAPGSLAKKFANLATMTIAGMELELDAVRVINSVPEVLGLAAESVTAKVEHLAQMRVNDELLELDATKIVNTCPMVLSYAPTSVTRKVENLVDLGLDAQRVISAFPQVLSLAPASVAEKVRTFDRVGLNPADIVHGFPQVLSYAPSSVAETFVNLSALGLNAAAIIATQPRVLSYAADSVLLRAMICEAVGVWPEIRAHWNAGEQLDLLKVPVESLALMAGLEAGEFAGSPSAAQRFARVHGWTTSAQRRAALAARLDPEGLASNAEFVNNLGYVAVALAARARGEPPLQPLTRILQWGTTVSPAHDGAYR